MTILYPNAEMAHKGPESYANTPNNRKSTTTKLSCAKTTANQFTINDKC